MVGMGSLGHKHHCRQCDIKFYDLLKRPVVCPRCKKEVTVAERARGARSTRARAERDAAPAPEIVDVEEMNGAEDEEEDLHDVDDVMTGSEDEADD